MNARRTCRTSRFLALAAGLALAGCAHHGHVSKTWQVEEVVEGSARPSADAKPRREFEIDAEVLRSGRLQGRVHEVVDGVEDVRRTTWHRVKVNHYHPAEALLMRPLLAPLYFALLGPFWPDDGVDYGGDGSIGVGDRIRFSLAMLNVFEAWPGGFDSERLDREYDTVTIEQPALVDLGGVASNVELRITSARGSEILAASAPDGRFDVDFAECAARLWTADIAAAVDDVGSGLHQEIAAIDSALVLEAAQHRGWLVEGDGPMDAEQREAALVALHAEARDEATNRVRRIELFRGELARKAQLAGHAPRNAARGDTEVLSLQEAVATGAITARARGRDLRNVHVSLGNLRSARTTVRIPAGTWFACNGSAQNMLCTADSIVTLEPLRSRSVSVHAACGNMHRATPKSSDQFTITAVDDENLARIAPLLPHAAADVRQAAVWILTDDPTRRGFRKYRVPNITDIELLQALALLLEGGVEVEGRAIWKWVEEDPR